MSTPRFSTTVHVTISFDRRTWLSSLLSFFGRDEYKREVILDTWRYREGMRMKEAAESIAYELGYKKEDVRFGGDSPQTETYYVREDFSTNAYKHILMQCIPYAELEH